VAQGQNSDTPYKEDGFRLLLEYSLRRSMAKPVTAFCYWHLDLNAGGGYNHLAGCLGSPAIFLNLAAAKQRRCRAYFFENNEAIYRDELLPCLSSFGPGNPTALPAGSRIMPCCEDNEMAFARVTADIESLEKRPHFAMGTVLSDPNGVRVGFPRQALSDFLQRFPRMDVLQSWNLSLYRSAHGCKRQNKKGFTTWEEIDDVLAGFGRKNWYVRNPPPARIGGQQFTVFYGTNLSMQGVPRTLTYFFALDSPEGRSFLREMKHIKTGQREFSF
jgi:hypothetical protein